MRWLSVRTIRDHHRHRWTRSNGTRGARSTGRGPARKLDANHVASARKRRRQAPTPLLKPCSVGALEYLCVLSTSPAGLRV